MKKLLFIMNPYAGMRKANRVLTDILEIFNRADYQVEIYMTAGPGDGAQYVKEHAESADLVVCCGGDGTFNETVSGIVSSGISVPLGYIPAGSTNDFAASLHLPADPVEAATAIMNGTPRELDIGRFADRYFSYVASFGAFTKASYVTPQNVKNALGHVAYVLEGISEVSQIKQEWVRLELDDRVIEGHFLFGAISNSTSVGGILTLDPNQVDMSDGKFEILLVRAPKDLLELGECIHALRTQKYNCTMLTFCSSKTVNITANPEMDWTLDGERESGHEHIEVQNLHKMISLIQ